MINRRILSFGVILIVILALPLTIWLVRNQHETRGRAAAPDQLEAEGGVLGGNAKIQTDTQASGGQYVAFANQTPTPTSMPSTPSPCPSNLQTAINNTATNGTLNITGCSYSLASPVTVSKAMTIQGGTITTTTKAITIAASDVVISGVHIVGPQYTTYNSGQIGIYANSAIQNITVKNNIIENFGEDGVRLANVTNLNVSGNTIKNIVYAGILIVSGAGGTVNGNSVTNIGVVGYEANGMNAYGIALTDQGGVPSSGITVSGNTVDNVPQWHGLDTHGGRNLIFSGNTIHRTNRAIFLTSSDGNGPAQNITVNQNTMDTPTKRVDVLNTYPYNEVGITVVSGAVNVTGTGNKFDGWPSGNHLNTQGGPNNFTNNIITNPQ